ncbi:MAG TPA: hypothetical protein VE377_00425 [Candidatus Dormibacteraeota bacterium]|nr:hypothetical protein [Candidatus Dormibacteraeota bacterium]
MFRSLTLALCATVLVITPAAAQDANKDKNLDVRSPVGDLHVGKDADAQKAGLPLYPGARPKHDANNDPVNFGLFTESFGLKLVVAKYETDDSAEKVLAFYRERMKKYGKVLDCRGTNDDSGFHSDDDDKEGAKPLKCDGDNTGPVRELKVGTEDNAHIVAIENPGSAKGTTFAIVYVRRHGKSGDI